MSIYYPDYHTKMLMTSLYPDIADRAIKLYTAMQDKHGVTMRCTETVRSVERQKTLFAQGRTEPGPIVTWSKPGYSMHNYFCAFDSCFDGRDPYLDILAREDAVKAAQLWNNFGQECRNIGLTWGGDFQDEKKDRPHAQLTYGLKLSELQKLFQEGGNSAIFSKFDELRKLNKI